MARFEKFIYALSSGLYWIARLALFSIMVLTCCDVFLRYVFNHPLTGGYDLVALLGAVIVSFSIPKTTLNKGHVIMEALTASVSNQLRKIFSLITGCLGIILFVIIGWNLFVYGTALLESGEVFPTLRLPIFYPAYAIGVCCVVECLVLVYRLLLTIKEESRP
jgi:TRAP-type C4-dicarboxylate transport system permease small subunit